MLKIVTLLTIVLWPAWFAELSSQNPVPAKADDSESMTIDGATHPELIPDHMVWHHLFGAYSIDKAKTQDQRSITSGKSPA